MKKKFVLISLLLAASMFISACTKSDEKEVDAQLEDAATIQNALIVAEGMIVPEIDVVLSSESGGTVSSILVSEGDWVDAGDELLRIGENTTSEAELKSVEFELLNTQQALEDLYQNEAVDREQAWQNLMDAQAVFDEAQEAYDDLDEDEYQDDLDDAEEDILDALQDVEDAQTDLEDYLDLDEDNATRKRYEDDLKDAQDVYNEEVRAKSEIQLEHDQIVNAFQAAQAALAVAQSEYEKRLDGPDVDALASLNAQIASLEAQKTAVEAQMIITAPFSGQIMEIYPEESEFVSPAQPVLVIADTSQWVVESNDVTELEISRIALNQPVSIEVEAFPGVFIPGKVDSISVFPSLEQGDVLYTVRIKLDATNLPELRWGMSVNITFEKN